MKEEYIVKILNQDTFGNGIARLNNKVIFVKNGIVGEEIRLLITQNKKNYSNAEIKEIIKRSEIRREYECSYYNECGGCNIAHQNYDYQLSFKRNKIVNSLSKIGRLENIPVLDTIPSNEKYYRNKIILKVDKNKIGLYDEGTHNITNINKCIISNDKINRILKILTTFVEDYPANNIKEVFIRSLNETMINISSDNFIHEKELLSYLEGEIIESILINDKMLKGKEYIISTILNTKFKVSKNSFFQINTLQTERLYNKIIEYSNIKKNDIVLDLYCGVGTISLILGNYAKKVIGIECIDDAIENAIENANLNNIKNVEFICGKVENIIESIDDKIDIIVLDPPRSGCDKLSLDVIKSINPRTIVYVSCNPDTLSRDLGILSNLYKVVEIIPYDMFPNTHHVECVCKLERKK